MDPQSSNASEVIARIAFRAKGVVTRKELLAAGVSAEQIKLRLRNGGLHVEYRGVYRVGHRAPDAEARYLAAVKACGEGAALSGMAAAWVLGIVKGTPPLPEVAVRTERRVRGVTTHRRKRVGRTRWNGIPVTTVPETLVDISPLLQSADLARACHEAGVRFKTTPRQVETVLRRRPNAKGAAKLRAVMSGETKVTLSKLEALFKQRLAERSLELPEMNRSADGRRVDCRWPKHKLTVELDSYRFHNSRHSWKQDRKREREAYERGDQFRRYDWDDVADQPEPMLAELLLLIS